MDNNNIDIGKLKIRVNSIEGYLPIENALIELSFTGDPDSTVEQIVTDKEGQSDVIDLATPPLEYSMEPGNAQPYSEYTLKVAAEGYEPIYISGVEVLPVVTAQQEIVLRPLSTPNNENRFVIPPHTLYGDYPPKIAEAEIKPINETGEIVLSRVVVPEYIVVHDGPPRDSRASDYYVRYKDYIKNVASSEIYATWPVETIRANVLAIMSFTLNRVYTEWYRNKGFNYTITSSTAYDHKWISGRNFFDTISEVVDELFAQYLSRPNVRQPILTQYCDGQNVRCPNWMSQWGSKYLGDEGYSDIEILRYYYGDSIYINFAEEISGVPASWPRQDLYEGSTGDKVKVIQEQLNAISKAYPAIPMIEADGIYGPKTAAAVAEFQKIFDLPVTGVVDYSTWYKISEIYVGVTRIAELY